MARREAGAGERRKNEQRMLLVRDEHEPLNRYIYPRRTDWTLVIFFVHSFIITVLNIPGILQNSNKMIEGNELI